MMCIYFSYFKRDAELITDVGDVRRLCASYCDFHCFYRTFERTKTLLGTNFTVKIGINYELKFCLGQSNKDPLACSCNVFPINTLFAYDMIF